MNKKINISFYLGLILVFCVAVSIIPNASASSSDPWYWDDYKLIPGAQLGGPVVLYGEDINGNAFVCKYVNGSEYRVSFLDPAALVHPGDNEEWFYMFSALDAEDNYYLGIAGVAVPFAKMFEGGTCLNDMYSYGEEFINGKGAGSAEDTEKYVSKFRRALNVISSLSAGDKSQIFHRDFDASGINPDYDIMNPEKHSYIFLIRLTEEEEV